MPRQRRGPRSLTPKQEAFCRHLVKDGLTQAEAYRRSYNTANMKPETIHKRASELLKGREVLGRVEQLREAVAKAVTVTVQGHLTDLADLRDEARQAGAFAPAVTAEVARGKVAGLYTEKHEHKVEGLDWKGLIAAPAAGETPEAGDGNHDP